MFFHRLKQLVKRILIRRDRFIENFKKLSDLIEKSELAGRVWLVGGMVLGLVRDGKMLEHDYDADFAFLEEDHERFRRFIPVLREVGFRPCYRWTNSSGRITEYTFLKDGAKFEFFVHFLSFDRNRIRWYSYHKRKRLELEREIPWHGTRPVSFLGHTWQIPARTEEYLERNYGSWKTPNPHFNYTKESSVPCGVERRPWKGTCLWKG